MIHKDLTLLDGNEKANGRATRIKNQIFLSWVKALHGCLTFKLSHQKCAQNPLLLAPGKNIAKQITTLRIQLQMHAFPFLPMNFPEAFYDFYFSISISYFLQYSAHTRIRRAFHPLLYLFVFLYKFYTYCSHFSRMCVRVNGYSLAYSTYIL